jgi:predicted nucleotidyltransferase
MNNDYGIYDKSFDLILEAIKKFPEVEKAILFGSRAMGNFKKGSDIDIAIKGERIGPPQVNRLNSILNQELAIPYFVELIDYKSITDQELKKHVDEVGKVVYGKKK